MIFFILFLPTSMYSLFILTFCNTILKPFSAMVLIRSSLKEIKFRLIPKKLKQGTPYTLLYIFSNVRSLGQLYIKALFKWEI